MGEKQKRQVIAGSLQRGVELGHGDLPDGISRQIELAYEVGSSGWHGRSQRQGRAWRYDRDEVTIGKLLGSEPGGNS